MILMLINKINLEYQNKFFSLDLKIEISWEDKYFLF